MGVNKQVRITESTQENMTCKSSRITLSGSEPHVPVEITDLPESGAFVILVSDELDCGTRSIFFLCKTSGKSAVISRPITSIGTTPELPTVTWANGHRPQLKFLITPHDQEDRTYIVTIIGQCGGGGGEGDPGNLAR